MGLSGSKINAEEFLLDQIDDMLAREKLPGSKVLKLGGKCIISYPDSTSLQIISEQDMFFLRKLRLTFKQSICQNFSLIEKEIPVPSKPRYYVVECREPAGTSEYFQPEEILPTLDEKGYEALAFQIMYACDQLIPLGMYPDPKKGFALRKLNSRKIVYFTPQYVRRKDGHVQKMFHYVLDCDYFVMFNGFQSTGYISNPKIPQLIDQFLGVEVRFNPDKYRHERVDWQNIPCFTIPVGDDISSTFIRPTFFIKPKSATVIRKFISTTNYIEDILMAFIVEFERDLSIEGQALWPDGDESLGNQKLRSREELQGWLGKWFGDMSKLIEKYQTILRTIKTVDSESVVAEKLMFAINAFSRDLAKYQSTALDEYETLLSFQDLIESFECSENYADFLFALINLRYYPTVKTEALSPYLKELDYITYTPGEKRGKSKRKNIPQKHYDQIREISGTETYRMAAKESLEKIIRAWPQKGISNESLVELARVLESPGREGFPDEETYLQRTSKKGKPKCDDDVSTPRVLQWFVRGLNLSHTIGQTSIIREVILGVPKVITDAQIDAMRAQQALKIQYPESKFEENLARIRYPELQKAYLDQKGLKLVWNGELWVLEETSVNYFPERTESSYGRSIFEDLQYGRQPRFDKPFEVHEPFKTYTNTTEAPQSTLEKPLYGPPVQPPPVQKPAQPSVQTPVQKPVQPPQSTLENLFNPQSTLENPFYAPLDQPPVQTPVQPPPVQTPVQPPPVQPPVQPPPVQPQTEIGKEIPILAAKVSEGIQQVDLLEKKIEAGSVLITEGALTPEQKQDLSKGLMENFEKQDQISANTVVTHAVLGKVVNENLTQLQVAADKALKDWLADQTNDLKFKQYDTLRSLLGQSPSTAEQAVQQNAPVPPQVQTIKKMCVYTDEHSQFGNYDATLEGVKPTLKKFFREEFADLKEKDRPVLDFACTVEERRTEPIFFLMGLSSRKENLNQYFELFAEKNKIEQPISFNALAGSGSYTNSPSPLSGFIDKTGGKRSYELNTFWRYDDSVPRMLKPGDWVPDVARHQPGSNEPAIKGAFRYVWENARFTPIPKE